MILVPRQGVIVERVAAVQVLRAVRVEEMEHQEDVLHVLLVKDRQIVDLLLVREEVLHRVEGLRPLAHLRDDKKLRDEALRKQKTGLAVGVEILELGHERFDVGVWRRGMRDCSFALARRTGFVRRIGFFLRAQGPRADQFFGRISIRQVRPGQLNEKLLILSGLILLLEFVEILLIGLVLLQQRVQRREGSPFMKLRVALPEHIEPFEGIAAPWLFMDRRVQDFLLY